MISPALLATVTAASVLLAVVLGRRIMAARTFTRAVGRLGVVAPVERRRRAMLAGPAARFAATRPGAALESYATQMHPQVAFSDVVAWLCCGFVGGALAGAALFPRSPLIVATTIAGPVVLDRVAKARGSRARRKLAEELPDALQLQAAALRAGHSVASSLSAVASELGGGLGDELKLVTRSLAMGEPLDAALAAMQRRVVNRDIDMWVTAMLVHRVSGGNLTAIISSLGQRIRQRQHLRAEVRALTAQTRLSGAVVASAPAAFFVILSITSREQMQVLFTTRIGWLLLLVGGAMQTLGYLWIRRIAKVRL